MSGLLGGPSSSEDLGPRAHSTSAFRDGSYGGFADVRPFAPSQSTPNFAETGVAGSRLQHRRFSQQLYGQQLSPQAANRGPEDRGRPAIYSMLPLDTVNADGVFRYAGSAWFAQALQLLVSSGAHGVAMDLWWGAIEKSPGQYNWAGYKQALEVIKQTGLKVQAVLSFHACGGNVGDTAQISLPEWVLQCGGADPDLFFADRPRNGGLGNRNREYISIWADDAPGELGTVIDEVVIGAGPCGELRLPSYVEANGWRFPGAGEFQCYDRRALASLAQAAREAGHPEWGYTGPHDAGEYNSTPELTGFFSQNGSWNTPYGRFFLEWYSGCLIRHGDRLLSLANQVFSSRLASHSAGLGLQPQGSGAGLHSSSSQQFNILPLASNLSSGGRASAIVPSTGSGSAHTLVSGGTDASMADFEPSDASHTSMVAPAEMLPAPPLSDSGSPSHRPPAAAVAVAPNGPSLTAMRFRSSTSTLAESEPLFGQDAAAFGVASAAAADGALVTSGGAARMDLCTSLSSLSTEFTTTTTSTTTAAARSSRQAAGMRYLDVAASLVAGGGDDGSDGTSCRTSSRGEAEEADDLFVLAAEPGRRGSGRSSEPDARGPLSDEGPRSDAGPMSEGARTSQRALGGMRLGSGSMGMAAAAAAAAGVGVAVAVPSLLSPAASCSVQTPSGGGGGLHLALKIAGIHWWYRSRSHAAELTAGYYNTDGHDGYAAIVEMCARHRANLVLTCVEMCDAQHPAQAQCGPEGLLRQLRQLAARSGPIFSSGGVDTEALDRIVRNMRACSVAGPGRSGSPALMPGGQPYPVLALAQPPGSAQPLQAQMQAAGAAASWGGGGGNIVCFGYRMSESGRMVPVGATAPAAQQQEQLAALQVQLPQYQGVAATAAVPLYSAAIAAMPMYHAATAAMPMYSAATAAMPMYPAATAAMPMYPAPSSMVMDAHMSGFAACASPAPPDVYPALRAFTFLRLVPEMLLPGYQGLWLRFMGKLLASS
ncbi:Beta-amylase 3, chloroplastic [Tetrabaena socialis]|uniref:Beta-amylase n=1 Tax=Tetrabaena socialis TaxID=47790 RepID=A0A2J7ZRF4_9CHLO|nr:Beta-amylase 3, chloroplastic [Tetrabaena socialis]|eukprot:PNH02836.1 Beta-amylase 3, chloroplastic [Tetrabaena socialis]